jgi:hypothetical protein
MQTIPYPTQPWPAPSDLVNRALPLSHIHNINLRLSSRIPNFSRRGGLSSSILPSRFAAR